MRELQRLYSHPLIGACGQYAAPGMADAARRVHGNAKQVRALQRKNWHSMSKRQRYDSLVTRALIACFNPLERAALAIRLASQYPTSFHRPKTPIGRGEWFDYHFGEFTVSLVGSFDVCLVATNAVLQLGLATRDCREERILGDRRLKGAAVIRQLKAIRRTVRPHAERRHGHVHRGENADIREIDGTDFFMHLHMLSFMAKYDSSITRDFLSEGWAVGIREVRPKLKASLATTIDAVSEFFTALQPLYESRRVVFAK